MMSIEENPFEDILSMEERTKLLQKHLDLVQNHANNVDRRKQAFISRIQLLEENSSFIPPALDELVKQFAKCEENRKLLKENWERLVAKRNSINKIGEEIEKQNKVTGTHFTSSQRVKIEMMLIEFDQVIKQQEQVLTKRESVLKEEDRLLTEMEELLNS